MFMPEIDGESRKSPSSSSNSLVMADDHAFRFSIFHRSDFARDVHWVRSVNMTSNLSSLSEPADDIAAADVFVMFVA